MTITSTRVHSATIVDGCDLRGISCMGNKRHLVRLDDNHPVGPGIFTQRYILSTDDGFTFGEQPEQTAPFLPLGPMFSVSPNVLLGGFGSGHVDDPYGSFALISRSTDGGATWTAAISADLYSTLTEEDADVFAFVRLDTGAEILAFGGVSVTGSGLRYQVLRSLDTGVSFALFAQVGTNPNSPLAIVNAACYAGDNVVLAAGNFLGGAFPNVSIWRSADRGQNWVEIALPAASFGSVACFAALGGGGVLAGGQVETLADSNHIEAVVWRSTDYGATWSAYTLPEQPFHGGGGLQRYTVNALRALTVSKVVAGVSIFGPPMTTKNWRLSLDGGATFPDSGVETSPLTGTASVVREITGADDGALLTGMTKFGGLIEIWRSTVDGFNGPGPCASSFDTGGGGGTTSPCSTPFRNRLGNCLDTLTDDDIIRGRWQGGDRLIINRVIFSIDWDAATQQFTKHVVYTFGDSVKKYGLRPAMRIESKGIRSQPTACGSDGTQGCALSMLDERAFNLGARFADPPPLLNLEIFYRKHTWEPSDVICVTSAFVPNMIAGRRGITNEAYEVVNIQQQFAPEGKILLSLLDVEAITLPVPPVRLVAEDEEDMLNRLREQQVYMTEIPHRLRELRVQRRETALFRRGKTQEGVAAAPAPAPRREVFAGISRGTFPKVP